MTKKRIPIYNVIAAILLLTPLAAVVATAFNSGQFAIFPPTGFSLDWFAVAFSNPSFMNSLQVSLLVGVSVTAISILIGFPAAYALTRYSYRGKRLSEIVALGPLSVPEVVVGLSIFVYFATLLQAPPSLGSLILAHAVVGIPIGLQVLVAALEGNSAELEKAAETLGASKVATFLKVTLPLALPGIIGASILVFIFSFDNVSISLFMMPPGQTTLPVQMYQYLDFKSDPSVAAMSAILVAAGLVIFLILNRAGALKHLAGSRL